MEKAPSSSRSSSRRTSSNTSREPLPTPPPDPRDKLLPDNAVDLASTEKLLPLEFHSLLRRPELQEDFRRRLSQSIANDCKEFHSQRPADADDHAQRDEEQRPCEGCHKLGQECAESMEPLHYRLNSTITAALAAYGAIEQLNRMYALWDQYLSVERELKERKECLRYVNSLATKTSAEEKKSKDKGPAAPVGDAELDGNELEQSIALLESILRPESAHGDPKQQRERSKSFVLDEMPSVKAERVTSGIGYGNGVPPLLRRQSTYNDGKAKVSKWTKVKAAFKWERANVPALADGHRDSVGLSPNNTEVARYLRVPSMPCAGGSSADSVFSSSSGHILSEAGTPGTPGTISSASSMDDLDNSGPSALRRDSSKSDIVDLAAEHGARAAPAEPRTPTVEREAAKSPAPVSVPAAPPPTPAPAPATATATSASNKSMKRSKAVPEHEVGRVNNAASQLETKTAPRPSHLEIKQDFNDSDQCSTSSQISKLNQKDGTHSLNRHLKRIASPNNSSVPSSPSRHSDFFGEFESEELSSSEPTTPSQLNARKSFQQKQDEINQRYQLLRAKLDLEFEAKRKEWEKLKTNRGISLVSPTKVKSFAPISPTALGNNLSAKLLEENLTADFKKKLHKWRVRKQASIGGIQGPAAPLSPLSPLSPTQPKGEAAKIDWSLWKTGQLKLEGQGLSPLPDQKDLPEDFQKKLEQWNRIKRGGSATDSLKRTAKSGEGDKKVSGSGASAGAEEERSGALGAPEKEKRPEKHKPHDKTDKTDKSERLTKLKLMVGEHPAKKIEVKTAAGVMKFEGISRKFTRKLYEWEKARGIGPESSTFALLHPGYCPLDVKRISKESPNNESSPTLGRSLSLDSITPNMALPVISQQASSLSLNDVNELREMEEAAIDSTDALASSVDDAFKKFEEPEAVMVEVEDHIVETASPLITTSTLDQQQTPVYKYEEDAMSRHDYCKARHVQSFESSTNLTPLLAVLENSDDLLRALKRTSPELAANAELRRCEHSLALIRLSCGNYANHPIQPTVLNAISDVQHELSRLRDLCERSPLDEACCREVLRERAAEYNDEIQGWHESLEALREHIEEANGPHVAHKAQGVPDINVTSEDGLESSITGACDTTLEATDDHDAQTLNVTIPRTSNSSNNNNNGNGNGNGSGASNGGAKKKVRLRKVGSRQNSKTESDSSDDGAHSVPDTPRRLKRKNFRPKQRSLDEEVPRSASAIAEDTLNGRRVSARAGLAPEQSHAVTAANKALPTVSTTRLSEAHLAQNSNIFVKTKRKLFTTVPEPTATDGIAVIEHEVEQRDGSPKRVPEFGATSGGQESVGQANGSETPAQGVRELDVKPRVLLVHKSLSLDDVRALECVEDEAKSQSVENVKSAVAAVTTGTTTTTASTISTTSTTPTTPTTPTTRPPLAADSFRVINKSCPVADKQNSSKLRTNLRALFGPATPKEHLFKKYLPQHAKANGATVKRIENKITKTQSSSAVPEHSCSSRLDTMLPRPSRKWERKSLTPTIQQNQFEYPTATAIGRPLTPLTERAQRLQKAKEQFLQGHQLQASSGAGSSAPIRLRDNIVRDEHWTQNRQSDQSLSSTTLEESSLLEDVDDTDGGRGGRGGRGGGPQKSASADTITGETPTQSDTGTDQDVGGLYDSLPRAVTRSGKISSKLGLATLASKLRRVKAKKPKDAAATGGGGASVLAALCRQSLFADVIAVPEIRGPAESARVSPAKESVQKSRSSPQAAAVASDAESSPERLDKSQSEHYVRSERRKESCV